MFYIWKNCLTRPKLTCHAGHGEHGENARVLGRIRRTRQHLLRIADLLPQAPVREEGPLGKEEDPTVCDPDTSGQRLPQAPSMRP